MIADRRFPRPIFVVGAPRSGTTLMASMIASHPEISGGPETHFFSKVSPQRLAEVVADPRWPRLATELLAGLQLSDQSVLGLYGADRSSVSAFLDGRTPSVAAMLDSVVGAQAVRAGKPRWVEKTPNHLLHLNQILNAFPDARIVRMVRDPRAVAVSMCGLPWAGRQPVSNAMLWESWHARSTRSFADHRDVTLTVRFEDVLRDPAATIAAVCDHIGAEFDSQMLDFAAAGAALSSPQESWKRRNNSPLDPSRGEAWRDRLAPEAEVAISLTCHDGMHEFGYPTSPPPRVVLHCYPPELSAVDQVASEVGAVAAARGVGVRFAHGVADAEPVWLLPGHGGLRRRVRGSVLRWWVLAYRTARRLPVRLSVARRGSSRAQLRQ